MQCSHLHNVLPLLNMYVVSMCRSFDTKAGEWHDVQLPFEQFIPLFRAKTVKDGAKMDASTVTSIQVSTSCHTLLPIFGQTLRTTGIIRSSTKTDVRKSKGFL